ncbi:MAG: hydrogenase iron-sulfur subunit [Candidatus Ranarchaeia archaeon]
MSNETTGVNEDSGFEPRIIGFLCRWCSYQGADLAGIARKKYPPNISIIRTNCTGRIDPTFVLEAFDKGADGVLISGCHPGDCHYQEGIYNTIRRFNILQQTLDQLGLSRERLRLEFISASEGDKFATVVQDMVESIRKLGPLRRVEERG